jgi:hypothetical protein
MVTELDDRYTISASNMPGKPGPDPGDAPEDDETEEEEEEPS